MTSPSAHWQIQNH